MLLCGSGQIMGMAMSDMRAERMAAGVSFLFDPGERPDGTAWRRAIEGCQARVRIGHEDAAAGVAEIVLDGLSFDMAGLAPASAWKEGALEAVRLYPGGAPIGRVAAGPGGARSGDAGSRARRGLAGSRSPVASRRGQA